MGNQETSALNFEKYLPPRKLWPDLLIPEGFKDLPSDACTKGQADPDEIGNRWGQAQLHPIPPVPVKSGPVQEEIHLGANFRALDTKMI